MLANARAGRDAGKCTPAAGKGCWHMHAQVNCGLEALLRFLQLTLPPNAKINAQWQASPNRAQLWVALAPCQRLGGGGGKGGLDLINQPKRDKILQVALSFKSLQRLF